MFIHQFVAVNINEHQSLDFGMEKLKQLPRAILGLLKRAWLLPQSFGLAVEQRRRQTELNLLEAERLDRIRNPSKYLGK